MDRQQNRLACVAQPAQQFHDHQGIFRGQPGGRLVQEQHGWVCQQLHRQIDAFALTAADPFNVETDNDAPAGEELTIGTEPEPRADEENEPEKEAVEPLPFGVETPVTDQTAAPVELDDQQLERISRRVVELLSESVVREVAWETVPEIAERLIRERIRDIEAEADTSN